MNHFMDGMLLMGYAVAALFFLRFWRRTADRLFLMFSIAFGVLAVNRLALAYITQSELNDANEHRTILYVVRLLAFGLILIAIIDKNRKSTAAIASSVNVKNP